MRYISISYVTTFVPLRPFVPNRAKRRNMTKKTFVRGARLVEGKKWYIEYDVYSELTGISTRHRKSFDLNKIADFDVRRQVGQILARYLADFVAPDQEPPAEGERGDSVQVAVDFSLKIKLATPRKNTHKSYLSVSRHFLSWCESRHYKDMPVEDFTRKHSQAYFDYLRTAPKKPLRGRTLNNYLITLRALWGELQDREVVADNPWSKIKPAREEEKKRRAFTDAEKRTVAEHIRRTDYWLFRCLLLQYFCFIRPVEISRLKFRAFDLKAGTVKVEAFEAKKWKTRVSTIPHSILPFFIDGIFDAQPAHFYIFGLQDNGQIGPSAKSAGENRQYKRHRKALEFLKQNGALQNIVGLTWYSWKDTGISRHARATSPLATRDQAGHTDFDMTLTYYQADTINAEYQALKNDLI